MDPLKNYKLALLNNKFVIFGPLIATFLTILGGHLLGILFVDNFGSYTSAGEIVVMIIVTIPFTICAYIVGLLPAVLTGQIFSFIINCMLKRSPNSEKIVFIQSAMMAVLFWVCIVFPCIWLVETKTNLWNVVALLSVIALTTLACAWLEWRVYKLTL